MPPTLENPIRKNNVTILSEDKSQTLILAHGFGTDQTSWKHIVDAFKDKYRIILYDNVGGGKSDPDAFSPNRYDSLDAYAQDLIDLCNSLEINDAIIVAHSVSGMISLLASIKQPDLFSKLILIAASPRYLNDVDYVGGFDQPTLDELYDTMANNYYAWVSGFATATMANPDKPHLAENFAKSLAEIRPDIAQSVLRVIFQSDYRSSLAKLTRETALIHTKEDLAVPREVADYLHAHIQNSTLQIINATGHFPHISAPQELENALKQLI